MWKKERRMEEQRERMDRVREATKDAAIDILDDPFSDCYVKAGDILRAGDFDVDVSDSGVKSMIGMVLKRVDWASEWGTHRWRIEDPRD